MITTTKIYRLTACLVLLLVWGCGQKLPPIKPLPKNAVILAFGDSLTYGIGAEQNESYPEVLSTLISRKVVKSGIPGELSANGLKRLPQVLEEYKPQLLLLCHGGNDFLKKLDKKQTAGNIDNMVQLAKSKGIDVILLGVPKLSITISPPQFYRQIADKYKIPYEGDLIRSILFDNSLKSDYIHPNNLGYHKMAERIRELLEQTGGLSP